MKILNQVIPVTTQIIEALKPWQNPRAIEDGFKFKIVHSRFEDNSYANMSFFRSLKQAENSLTR